jgi:hypothetical protein
MQLEIVIANGSDVTLENVVIVGVVNVCLIILNVQEEVVLIANVYILKNLVPMNAVKEKHSMKTSIAQEIMYVKITNVNTLLANQKVGLVIKKNKQLENNPHVVVVSNA